MKNGSVISTSSVPRTGVSVRAHDPGQQDRQRDRRDGLGERETDRVEQDEHVLGGEDLAIAVEIELAGHAGRRRMQAAVEQHRQRIERQEAEQKQQQCDADAAADGRARQRVQQATAARRAARGEIALPARVVPGNDSHRSHLDDEVVLFDRDLERLEHVGPLQ